MELITPPFLQKGDTIGIAATARKISREELQIAIDIIHNFGYKVKLATNIFSEYHQWAGTDKERISGFQELLNDNNIKAILIARGGYGTVRILDHLDFQPLFQFPKWICGFSDVTALLSHLFNLGIKSIHSTMPILFHQSKESVNSLFNLLEGKENIYTFEKHSLNRNADIEGIMVGGNLSVLYSLAGSVSEMKLKDKILFIEDIDEYLYHIDRMMMQLKRSGQLKHLKALIVGGFTDMKDNNIPFGKNAYEIIADVVKEYDYPVFYNFPGGHIVSNYAFINGGKVKISVKDEQIEFRVL
ncbi:MAG: LD-carboxypeptidase [Bacteroidia bacterium]